MFSIVLIVTCCYVLLLGLFLVGALRLPEFKATNTSHFTKFSIIVPFRNEVEHLNELLTSFENVDYPRSHFEIILINDSSEDGSISLVKSFTHTTNLEIKLMHSYGTTKSPKKEALLKGINKSNNNWIVTTDADCAVPRLWLKTLNAFIITKTPNMVVMPVFITNGHKKTLECLETLCLQTVTMGSFGLGKPIMNNGANLAYQKSDFFHVKGFIGNEQIASGDDMFLFEKFIKYNLSVQYLKSKSAIVLTKPQKNLNNLISQRIRWASKTSASKNVLLKISGVLIFSMNLLVLILLGYSILMLKLSTPLLIAISSKFLIDLMIMAFGAKFFIYKLNYFNILKQSLAYPFANVYIAIRSMFGGFSWKDRAFEK